MSPGRSVGPKRWVIEARKAAVVNGPSSTRGAVSPVARRAPTKVVVCQDPWGTGPTQRWPRGARPHCRVSLVVNPLSSRNTKRELAQVGCRYRQCCRAATTSERVCSCATKTFFSCQVQPP